MAKALAWLLLASAMVTASPQGNSRQLLCGDEICSVKSFPAANDTGWQSSGAAKGMFCLNQAPLDRETLGHVSWSFLHTTAAYLPTKLTPTKKKAFLDLVHAVDEIYACSLCRDHFQALIREDPIVVRELNAIDSAEDASLWLWKVHNMVTHTQHPNRPLWLKGLNQPEPGVPTMNASALQAGFAPAFTQNSSNQIRLSTLMPRVRAEVYDAILQRWRAAGGRVAVPSMFAPLYPPGNATVEKATTALLKVDSSGPKMKASQCSLMRQELRQLNSSELLSTCPNVKRARAPGSKVPLKVFTMGRCPYCAATMETLWPFLSGEMWSRFDFKNRYVLQQAPGAATSLMDFVSVHGAGEVLADAYELCAQYQYPGGLEWYKFVRCQDETYWAAGYGRNSAKHDPKNCAHGAGIDYANLAKCANGPMALRLLSESVKEVEAANIAGAPAIEFAGRSIVGMLSADELGDYVCMALACHELQPESSSRSASFATETSLFSEPNQNAYRAVLASSDKMEKNDATALLNKIRLELGITAEDHRRARQMMQQSKPVSVGSGEGSSDDSSVVSAVVFMMLGVAMSVGVVVGMFVVVKRCRDAREMPERAAFRRIPNFVYDSQMELDTSPRLSYTI